MEQFAFDLTNTNLKIKMSPSKGDILYRVVEHFYQPEGSRLSKREFWIVTLRVKDRYLSHSDNRYGVVCVSLPDYKMIFSLHHITFILGNIDVSSKVSPDCLTVGKMQLRRLK